MKRVTLHVDQLVLSGFRPEERHGVAAGLQRELIRMLSDPQTARQLLKQGDVSRLRLGKITIRHGTDSPQVGTQVARGIDRSMKR